MKTRKILFFLSLTSIFFNSCARVPAERPEDFALSLYWDTGSLLPQYRYEYVITVGPGNQGQVAFQLGYGGEDPSLRRVRDFTITDEQLDALYTYLFQSGIFITRWKPGRRLIGERNTSLIITAYAREYRLPDLVEFSDDQREQTRQTIEGIKHFIPDDTWLEMMAFQQEYENSFE